MSGVSPDSIASSPYYDVFTVASAPTLNTIAAADKQPCRWIRANEAGTLIVTRLNGTSVTLNFLAGETQLIQALAITGGTVTSVQVYW